VVESFSKAHEACLTRIFAEFVVSVLLRIGPVSPPKVLCEDDSPGSGLRMGPSSIAEVALCVVRCLVTSTVAFYALDSYS
jgi:hypothetical protein